MLGSRILVGVGLALAVYGIVVAGLSKRTEIYEIGTVFVVSFGATLLVMGWMGPCGKYSGRVGHGLLWTGVGLIVLTAVLWNTDHRSPEHKVGFLAIPWAPALALMVMGRAVLRAKPGTDRPG